ncbi:hypothetical protein ACFWP7_03340 [Streptomyces sp. NPDC058470]
MPPLLTSSGRRWKWAMPYRQLCPSAVRWDEEEWATGLADARAKPGPVGA